MKKNSKGILFWITGFSGSGKTQISKKIHSQIKKNYGPTILFSGDDIRKIFDLKGYTYEDRLQTVRKYCKLAKSITNQNINVWLWQHYIFEKDILKSMKIKKILLGLI